MSLKTILSLLLCFAMLTCVFAGCSGTEPSVSPSETTSEAPVQSDGTSEPEEAPGADGSELQFPFSEELVTLSVWTRAPAGNMQVMTGTFNEYEIFNQLEEKSNVKIEWQEFSNEAAPTQFNLMCASGEYSDILTGVEGFYSGGLAKAYEDGIVSDMQSLIEQYAVNYSAILDSNESIAKECVSDDGSQLAFFTINDEPDMAAGLFIRQDWLDALGLSMPQTYDELTGVLSAFKAEYNTDYTLLMTESCLVGDSGDLTAGFGVSGHNVVESNRYHMYIDKDGKVTSSLVEDGYREYLTFLADLYTQGLIGSDFFTVSSDPFTGDTDKLIVSSDTGIFKLNTRGIDNILNNAEDETFTVTAMPNIGTTAGLINNFSDASLVNTNASASISSTCALPEVAVKWLDYWYSDEGTITKNYGVEGVSYELIDGKPQFTESLINNEWGVSVDTAITRYNIQNVLVGNSITTLTWDYYTETQQDAKTLWKSTCNSSQVLPGTLSLTSEESETYATVFSDISTYVATTIPQFIIGDKSLDDWDEYISMLESMGIDECIGVYQQSYDRFQQR